MKDYGATGSRRKRLPLFLKSWQLTPQRIAIAIGAGIILFLGVLFWITKDLPTPDSIITNAKYSTTILDRNDKVIYEVFQDKNIVPITYDELPKDLIQATISIEDKDFFKHGGFSIGGIFRALLRDIFLGKAEGGSTLSQQLIKNTLLTSEKSLVRKTKEFILAIELERRYTKEQILEMYFNQTPYGGTTWGVGSASQYYFGKKPAQLTLLQSAILAGLPQNPSIYSPFIGEKDAYIHRTEQVLRRLREDKYITKEAEEELVAQLPKVKFVGKGSAIQAGHFVFYVKDQLDNVLANDALLQKGLVIKTTLDLDLQKQAEKIVKEEVLKAKGLNITNGALVAMDPKTGEILAMVGSLDYNNEEFGKFNVTTAKRQPGSTLKPFMYALAFENNYTPSSILMDVSTEFYSGSSTEKPYKPENYDGKYRGPVQFRFSLGSSLNVPAVKLLAQIGIRPFLQKLSDAGLTTLEPTDETMRNVGLSLVLGGGDVRLIDLASAYTSLANSGTGVSPLSIREVRDYRNRLIYKPQKPATKKVFTAESTFLVSHILTDNNARSLTFGTYNNLVVSGKTVAAKTGTTDDKRDNWTAGYTKDIVIVTWVGNNDNSKMNPALASGVSGAAPIWNRVMSYALSKDYQDNILAKPSDVEATSIDGFFGGTPKDGYPTRSEYFIRGTEPKEVSPFYKKVKVSKSTGKKANDVEIAKGDYEEKDLFVVEESDPISTDGKNRWQEGINAWAQGQSDEKWKGPTEVSENNADDISISVEKPEDNKKYDGGSLDIKAKVTTNKDLEYFRLFINDTQELDTKDKSIEMTKGGLGNGVYTLTFKARNNAGKETERKIIVGLGTDLVTPTPEPTEP
ncbi:MAG: transglycosylase domain-containing protein [Candidatus Roizmanbacteria bacterium]|nr:transglycosylase domain-containing protein [Candidatus Roizmanbacteria bacterium]